MAKRHQSLALDMRPLGRRIRAKRKEAGLSQEEPAGRIEGSVPCISKLEAGAATLGVHRAAEIADLFGCDAAELLGVNAGSPAYLAREPAEKYCRLTLRGKEMALGLPDALLSQAQYRKDRPANDDLQ